MAAAVSIGRFAASLDTLPHNQLVTTLAESCVEVPAVRRNVDVLHEPALLHVLDELEHCVHDKGASAGQMRASGARRGRR